jgi:uncharacterized protein DUF3309
LTGRHVPPDMADGGLGLILLIILILFLMGRI